MNPRYWYSIGVPEGWAVQEEQSGNLTLIFDGEKTPSLLRIEAMDIDTDAYPNLDAFLEAGYRPGDPEGSEDFFIGENQRMKPNPFSEFQQYKYTYSQSFEGKQHTWVAETHWYIAGGNLIKVTVLVHEDHFDDRRFFAELEAAQNSFKLSSFVDFANGFTVSHPPDWIREGHVFAKYSARSPLGTPALVITLEDTTAASIHECKVEHVIDDAEIINRELVHQHNANPGCRVDFITGSNEARGASLIRVNHEGKAVWVTILTKAAEWPKHEKLVDRIFSTVVVPPLG